MPETDTEQPWIRSLTEDHESAVIFGLVMLLGGLAAGWAGRSLLAGETLTEQFWLVPVVVGLGTALYAQANGV
jgi:anti-sigma factor RsiW